MPAPKPVITIKGFDASGNAVTIEGQDANRVLQFSEWFAISVNTDVEPNRVEVTISPTLQNYLATVSTLAQAILSGEGKIDLDTITVRRIIAMGTGNAPDPDVPDLVILTKTPAVGIYDEAMRFVAKGDASTPRLSWFGATAQPRQNMAYGHTYPDLFSRLENYNLVTEDPAP